MAAPTPFPPDHAAVLAHAAMLQEIINRLAGAGASCKTWCVTLVSGLLALSGVTELFVLAMVTLVPVIIFGYLDASYLAQERAYRTLFRAVIDKVHAGTYTLTDTFDVSARIAPGARLSACFSWSIAPLYLTLTALTGVVCMLAWLDLLGQDVVT